MKFCEIAKITMGQSPKSESYNNNGVGIPFLQGRTTFGRMYPFFDTWSTQYNRTAQKGDILFTVRAPVGDINIANRDIAIGRGIAAITGINNISNKYLFYLIEGNKSKFIESSVGTIYDSINRDELENVNLNVHDSKTQQHIVDSIGSVDDAIEKNEEIIDKIYSFLNNKFNELINNRETVSLGGLDYFRIVKSGIDEFEGNKIYIDTSSVSNKSIIDTSYNITYYGRPSRANMQPLPNTVWFAKLKDSPKYIIVKNSLKRILNSYVFSTGFMGLEADEYIINYLYLLILSDNFNSQKDASSTGATMMGINNDILYSIKVPIITKDEAYSFGKDIDNFIETIISLQEKNYILKSIKKNLLSKYFD